MKLQKNERSNIEPGELAALKRLATDLFRLSDSDLARTVADGTLQEVSHE